LWSPPRGVVSRTDSAQYAAGDRPTVTLENHSPTSVGYNLCFAFLELDRLEAETWKLLSVDLGPGGNVDCQAFLAMLQPGMIDSGRLYLPDDLPRGRYRLVHNVTIGDARQRIATNEFDVA
jgi:hypothetical protein